MNSTTKINIYTNTPYMMYALYIFLNHYTMYSKTVKDMRVD